MTRRRRAEPPRCPVDRKVCFPTEGAALRAMYLSWRRGHIGEKLPIRAYLCDFCTTYHLTSQPKRKR